MSLPFNTMAKPLFNTMAKPQYRGWLPSCIWGLLLLMVVAPTHGAQASEETEEPSPASLRLDLYHTGDFDRELFSVDRFVVEPLPWAGNPSRPVDTTNLGKYRYSIRDADDDTVLFSRGYASIYGEWETTGEARRTVRTFHESLRFPHPGGPFSMVIEKRDAANAFVEVWRHALDPADPFVDPSTPPRTPVTAILENGDPAHKVDLLLLGDGYTAEEHDMFLKQARRLTEALFAEEPFRSRRGDFNVWAMAPVAAQSGVSRPSTGLHLRSPLGTTYDAFGSERYVLTFENRAWREVASWAPYDVVEILINAETYGGGGIFGLYGTVAAANDWAEYLFVHEFGHHFAALADEYYTSSVAYETPEEQVEPWEVNATTLPPGQPVKWNDLMTPGTETPTAWPKEAFETHSHRIQERRREIRRQELPESVMTELFEEQRAFELELFGSHANAQVVGAFEGANYAPKGMYRPQMDCIMFSRNPVPFCAVCQRGIEDVIDLHSAAAIP